MKLIYKNPLISDNYSMAIEMEEELQVRCGEKDYGLVKLTELHDAISLGGVPFFAQVYNTQNKIWMPMSDHRTLSTSISKSIMCPSQQWGEGSIFGNWFVRAQDKNFGPFTLVQMIELYQQNNLSGHSSIRHPNFKDWGELVQTKPFDDQSVKALFEYPGLRQAFTQRKSPRVYYANNVCLSLNQNLYSGISLSLSKRGIGILVDDQTQMKIKDKLNLIINPNSEHGTIQSKCEVVSLNRCDGQDKIGLVFAQEIEPLTEYIERRVPIFQAA